MKPKKPTRLEKGILLAVVWLAEDGAEPSVAANMARSWGVHDRDVTDSGDLDRMVFARLNKYEGTKFFLPQNVKRRYATCGDRRSETQCELRRG